MFKLTVAAGLLVWRKTLTRTEALQLDQGNPVDGVRLTQAKFQNPPGQRINQTIYFRTLFADFNWEPEPGGHADQEHTFVPIHIIIRGVNHGVHNFEISHKPSGESDQGNYTTTLRWGPEFTPIVMQDNLTNTILSLYETPDAESPFLMEIIDP